MSETKKDQSKASGSSAKKPSRSSSRRKSSTSRSAAPKRQPNLAAHEKAIQEVRDIRQENEERAATHSVAVVKRDIPTEKGSLTVTTADGLTYVNDAVLNHEQLVTFRQVLDAAFQAVS